MKIFKDYELSTSEAWNKTSTTTTLPCLPCDTTPKVNIYFVVGMSIGGFVSLCLMITVVVLYKIRANYLLKRQINQFRRIDQQLNLDRVYTMDYSVF